MAIAPIQRQLEPADIPPERLAANSQLSEEQKIGEATRQFEAMLLRQILENTQKPVIQSKFTDNSTASTIYRDLVTCQLADSISRSGDLGLSKTLEDQFTQPLHSKSKNEGASGPGTPAAEDAKTSESISPRTAPPLRTWPYPPKAPML